MIRVAALCVLIAMIGSSAAFAEATLIYDRDGKVRSVVRASPSGFLVYDRDGRVVQAIRGSPVGSSRIVRVDRARVTVIGTGLRGGVGSSVAGVGLD